MSLDRQKQTLILDILQRLKASGQVFTPSQLEAEYRTFRERFGPEVLKRLQGPQLLQSMWNLGNRESLLYWLEQGDHGKKNKAVFGLIGGGSQPERYRLYRRAGSDIWVHGKSSRNTSELSQAEAIAIAGQYRDQLIRAAAAVEAMPTDGHDAHYLTLQAQLNEQAPDLSNLAWVHKYLHMLRPDLLDDFHTRPRQDQHLLWLGETLPKGRARFLCGGRFVRIAKQLDIPMNHLTAALNRCNPDKKKR